MYRLEILVEYPHDNKPKATITEKYDSLEEFQFMHTFYMREPTVKMVEIL